MKELGAAIGTVMKIKLIDNEPVHYRPRRLSYKELQKIKEIVEELEQNRISRESHSSYASSVLLVKKKNGESRMCMDYRALNTQPTDRGDLPNRTVLCGVYSRPSVNKKTKTDPHPLPHIYDQIDRLSKKPFFTSLDLKLGYHQIQIDEDSIELPAFVTSDDHYEWLRVPFGLKNPPL